MGYLCIEENKGFPTISSYHTTIVYVSTSSKNSTYESNSNTYNTTTSTNYTSTFRTTSQQTISEGKSGNTKSFKCTNTCPLPRMYVLGEYIPLLKQTTRDLMCKGSVNYKIGEETTYVSTHSISNSTTLTSYDYETRSSSYGTSTRTAITTRYY